MFSATITGRLGQDPKTRQAGQSSVTELSVATERGWGERKITTWVKVEIWGKTGEIAAQKLSKGSRVAASGEVYMQEYTARDGGKRQSLVMDCKGWELLDAAPAREDQGRGRGRQEDDGDGW